MKELKFLSVIFILALIVSACGGPAPAPTMSAADVQSTAMAAAFTAVAETQASIPTATPLPPTDTPTATVMPTDTPLPASTEVTSTPAVVAAAATSTSGGDPCNRLLSSSLQGKPTTIRIANTTKSEVTVSLFLSETAAHGECGYRSYVIKRGGDVVISDVIQGCYYLLAWSNDNSNPVGGSGSGCINNPDKWTFEIKDNTVKFVGP